MKTLAVALVLAYAISASADPWVAPTPGHGIVAIGYTRVEADEYFSGPNETDFGFMPTTEGTKRPIAITIQPSGSFLVVSLKSKFVENQMYFHGEVSLYKRLGFVASMPLVRSLSQSEAPDTYTGVGDLVLGLKYDVPLGARARGFAFGPQIFVTTPTGSSTASVQPQGTMSSFFQTPLTTGTGTVDIEPRLSAAYRFDPVPVFVVAEVGFHHHFNHGRCVALNTAMEVEYSDDLPYLVRVGGTWSPRRRGFDHTRLSFDMSGTHSFENGDTPYGGSELMSGSSGGPYVNGCAQNNNVSQFSLGGTLAYFPVKWVGVSYSVSHVMTGVNVGYLLTNSLGLVAEF